MVGVFFNISAGGGAGRRGGGGGSRSIWGFSLPWRAQGLPRLQALCAGEDEGEEGEEEEEESKAVLSQ